MNYLVLNVGSTSIKYAVLDGNKEYVVQEKLSYTAETFLPIVQSVVKKVEEYRITKILHRIVFGGEKYTQPTELTDAVVAELSDLGKFAPLHNPPALQVVTVLKKYFSDSLHIAIFDAAFHMTIPEARYLYALPYEAYEKYGIRRYGYHGISHSYIAKTIQKLEPKKSRIISCHLGGGASVCAIQDGKSVATSMGFSPSEGLIMGTRAGDVGVEALSEYLQLKQGGMQFREVLHTQSGLLGISGLSGDMRQLLQAKNSNPKSSLALEMYVNSIVERIGAYSAILGGVDVLVFTGGVGEGSGYIRSEICRALSYLGVTLSSEKNINPEQKNTITAIQDVSQPVSIYVVPAREEVQMLELSELV